MRWTRDLILTTKVLNHDLDFIGYLTGFTMLDFFFTFLEIQIRCSLTPVLMITRNRE